MLPSNLTRNDTAGTGRDASDEARGREGFRPVALPALAAAVQVNAAAARAARAKLAARRTAPIVHEDEPSL